MRCLKNYPTQRNSCLLIHHHANAHIHFCSGSPLISQVNVLVHMPKLHQELPAIVAVTDCVVQQTLEALSSAADHSLLMQTHSHCPLVSSYWQPAAWQASRTAKFEKPSLMTSHLHNILRLSRAVRISHRGLQSLVTPRETRQRPVNALGG